MMVLARITARVHTLPLIGEEHVVMGEARGAEGRKTWTAATLYDADGRPWPSPSTCGSPSTPPPSADPPGFETLASLAPQPPVYIVSDLTLDGGRSNHGEHGFER